MPHLRSYKSIMSSKDLFEDLHNPNSDISKRLVNEQRTIEEILNMRFDQFVEWMQDVDYEKSQQRKHEIIQDKIKEEQLEEKQREAYYENIVQQQRESQALTRQAAILAKTSPEIEQLFINLMELKHASHAADQQWRHTREAIAKKCVNNWKQNNVEFVIGDKKIVLADSPGLQKNIEKIIAHEHLPQTLEKVSRSNQLLLAQQQDGQNLNARTIQLTPENVIERAKFTDTFNVIQAILTEMKIELKPSFVLKLNQVYKEIINEISSCYDKEQHPLIYQQISQKLGFCQKEQEIEQDLYSAIQKFKPKPPQSTPPVDTNFRP